jgi:penicillin-binding protein 1A
MNTLGSKKRWEDLGRKALVWASIAFVFCGLCLAILVFAVSRTLPDVNTISTYIPNERTTIYSEEEIVLGQLHQEENRVVIPLEKISPIVRKAVVALEDTDFYEHHGINPKAIFRALIKDIIAGSFVEGGSTLTQQLAKNLFLSKKKQISRKVAEAILAVQIERKYSKDEILEMYLNQVYWGRNAYGIESASQQYFGKHANELSLAESALLVGMLQGPELYNPFKNFSGAKARQKIVLERMQKLQLITPETARESFAEPMIFASPKVFRYKAPYFTAYIVSQLMGMYGEGSTYTSGMRVYTSLNYKWQMKAMDVVSHYVNQGKMGMNFSQGALLAIDPSTGYIKALQGGADFQQNEYNRCVNARRQPGSAFKPIVYLAALEKGYTPESIVEDTPISFDTGRGGVYSPQNYTKTFSGSISIRRALEQSVNIVAIKLTNMIGPQNVVRVARQLGVQSPLPAYLSLPLGINEMTMLELASVYCVFANGGKRVEPSGITRIVDRDGNEIYKHQVSEKNVFDPGLIYSLVDMMRGVVISGTGTAARLPRPSAGKTGTTSDYRDAWFFGFVPQLVCATWVGNDDNHPMNKVTGGSVPALMWRDFMSVALASTPPAEFPYGGGRRAAEEPVAAPAEAPKLNQSAWDAAPAVSELPQPTPKPAVAPKKAPKPTPEPAPEVDTL